MKNLLLLCACMIVLLSCNNPKSTKNPELTFEDAAIGILRLYQNVDSQLVAERNELYQLLLKHSEPAEEASEEDKGYFLRNIVHIDSVVNQGAALIKENKACELLALLEAELPNFYAHPHNTVDNEVALHQLVVELYRRQTESEEEFLGKVIPLSEWTVMHIEAVEHKLPVYLTVLTELIVFYSSLENYDKVIFNGEKLSAYSLQTGDEETQIYASLLLSRAYSKIGQQEQKDSCINSVNHLSQFNDIYEAVKDMLNQ